MEEAPIPLNGEPQQQAQPGRDWLKIAQDAFSASTSYLDANWRKKWEDSIAMFQSRHPTGSKYNSDAYKHRSRLFRPKTRSLVRKNEAAAAIAFFSNPDVVSAEPENEADQMQVASADLMLHLLNYRLQKTIPWFKLIVGGVQTAQVYGIVCSYQYWHYKERTEVGYEPLADDLGQPLQGPDGPLYQEVESATVLKDQPCMALLPAENFRFDPGADWLDVVSSSPYFIRMVPMYVCDVKELMATTDRKTGQPKWKKLEDAEIRQAMVDYDTTRMARENRREDPLAHTEQALGEFEIVWCHENFVRFGSEETVYWTLGTTKLLTDPQPLAEVYFHGIRPFVIGTCVLEANKAMPDSLVQMGASLQRETNDTVNQRRDNVSLVLNKRYVVKRGMDVDVQSLVKNAAGSVTMTSDMDAVREMEWNDVTASSYQEQDRLNADYDELTGNFSASTMATNRRMNETVGVASLLSSGSNQMTEYLIRTLVETWVEPVLQQLVKLEQAYETDEVVLGLAGQGAKLQQRYGIDAVTDDLLNGALTVRVNIGMGATDPQSKLQRFIAAMRSYADIISSMPDVDPEAVRKELFGLVGYRDGMRFFRKGDPRDAQLQQAEQAIQQLQGQLAAMQADKQADHVVKFADADLKQTQAVKTMVEAGAVFDGQMMQQAQMVYGA